MIDWYAYTIEIPRFRAGDAILPWLTDAFNGLPEYIRPVDGVMDWSARRPGWTAGMNIGNHTFVWIRRDGLMLIEHTGKGCEYLRQDRILMRLIERTHETCTRVDLAVDIHNPDMTVTPGEFAEKRGLKRVSSGGTQVSKTGETVYIGSRKSDRYCRVYQYTDPHPRSDYMRIEYVLKKDRAKRACAEILAHGVHAVEHGLAAFYEWSHELYNWSLHEDTVAVNVPAAHIDRSAEKTIRWLYGPVTQSVRKMAKGGNLDIEEFLEHIRRTVETPDVGDIPF